MNVTVITRPELKAIVLKTARNGSEVRTAWKEVQSIIQERNLAWANRNLGYVFIPEWQWSTGVLDLWVGVEVNSFGPEHDGFELFTLPERNYAVIRAHGNREQLDNTYRFLDEWFKESGNERDYSQGSFGFEANQLTPINPFDVPADEINYFDFEIYAPIKSK